MERRKQPFFEELGSHGELKRVSTSGEALDLPWSLLLAAECEDDAWPPTALPMISALTPEDALEQMLLIDERWGVSGAHVVISAQDRFIDAEGVLEAARLFLDADYHPVLRSPLNWSVATRLSELGCLAVDVQAIVADREMMVSRPWLLERIIHDSVSPILLSGPFSSADARLWLSCGASAIVREED